MSRFSKKTIEQLSTYGVKKYLDEIQIDVSASELEFVSKDVSKIITFDQIGAWVDSYSDLQPVKDDYVNITLYLRSRDSIYSPTLELDPDDAENLGKLLIFQSKVAKRLRETKRQLLNDQAAE